MTGVVVRPVFFIYLFPKNIHIVSKKKATKLIQARKEKSMGIKVTNPEEVQKLTEKYMNDEITYLEYIEKLAVFME